MIKLRPHHLLCTQSYEGYGYNREFIKNMDNIIYKLKNTNENIQLVFGVDNICSTCPNKRENKCLTEKRVLEIDRKVIEYFSLEEKKYNYEQVILRIKNEITEEIFYDICGECEWYKKGICIEKILGVTKG